MPFTLCYRRNLGLYVSLSSFLGVGKDFLGFHVKKTGDRLYLNITSRRRPPCVAVRSAAVMLRTGRNPLR